MNLGNTRHSENEKGVVNPSRSLPVLVSGKKCQQARYESYGDNVSLYRRENEAGDAREDDESR